MSDEVPRILQVGITDDSIAPERGLAKHLARSDRFYRYAWLVYLREASHGWVGGGGPPAGEVSVTSSCTQV